MSAEAERRFPILSSTRLRSPWATIDSLPWALMETARAQAERNHCGQTLERLAERDGLSYFEAECALAGRNPFCEPYIGNNDERAAHDRLVARIAAFNADPSAAPAPDASPEPQR